MRFSGSRAFCGCAFSDPIIGIMDDSAGFVSDIFVVLWGRGEGMFSVLYVFISVVLKVIVL